MKKFIVLTLVISLMVGVLSGCGAQSDIDELNKLQATNTDAKVQQNYKLSYSDEQDMIYSQVSDRTLLDLTTLTACSDNELQQVINYLDSVDAQLCGTASSSDEEVIDSCFTDYLLCEFERTPYYWQRTQAVVRGIDAESRSIIVDVTYKTIDFNKDVQEESKIVLGEPAYEKKLQVRYDKWLEILNAKYNNSSSMEWQKNYDNFVKYYGDPELIIKSQSNYSLTENVFETGNQKTYQGLINSSAEESGATMLVRYVLVPNYVLGVNLGITCKHLYVLDYKLDNDVTASLELFTDEGYATVTDSVYELVYSYFQCMDEDDYSGLYSLTYDFGKLDKYYEDLFNTTYRKHDGFTISLFDITGTHITCGISIASKVRAKGSNMTFPAYTDRYYAELELVDGKLQVENLVLLSRTIEGEPAITTDEASTTGFAATIDLDNDDKLEIEQLICDFSAIQLSQDTTSDNFAKIVDISMETSDLSTLKENMTSLSGVRKVAWISNYQQGTSNYASVKCKELYQYEDNSITEASVTYDFIMKGGRWYVYSYNVLSSVRLSTTNLATTGCLCLVSPNKVESYTSQVKGTSSTGTATVSDASVVYDYKEYTPTLKTGSVEQGLDTSAAYDLSSEDFDEYVAKLFDTAGLGSYEDYVVNCSVVDDYLTQLDDSLVGKYEEAIKGYVAVYYNIVNNRYATDLDKIAALETANAVVTELNSQVSSIEISEESGITKREFDDALKPVTSTLSLCNSSLGRA